MINWYYEYLRTPGGPHAGEPFIPTLEQVRFILWFYEVDENGKRVYREAVLRRMKGWGKDPIAGAMALGELCGPVEFSHFDESGQAVGKPRYDPWVQIAAVSQDQTRNTFSLFPSLISDKLKQEHKLDVHRTLVYDGRGKIIEGVTSSPLALEGKRPTFLVLNETQWWLENNAGHDMRKVITGNAGKAAYATCHILSICNAHIPGMGSVGEEDWEAYMKVAGGQAIDTGILYDALEAPPDTPVSEIPSPSEDPEGFEEGIEKLKEGIRIARGDAVWLDVDHLVKFVLDVKNPVSESRRMYLNQINAAEDAWISPAEWDTCQDPENRPLQKGDEITLGFDGSRTSDHTALSACRISDGKIFLIKSWRPEDYYNNEIPREEVDAVVRSTFERYKVIAMRADVHEWDAYVDAWGKDFKRKVRVKSSPTNPVAFDMRTKKKQFAIDCERFLDAVLSGELMHDGNPRLRWYVLNAHRFPTVFDAVAIRKKSKDSSKKIDGAVTSILAFAARQEWMLSKKYSSGRSGAI